jgi:hypothetical protein
MRTIPAVVFLKMLSTLSVFDLLAATPVAAYVDPGTTGMLSQLLYVLFYGAVGAFFYFLRYAKGYLSKLKVFLARCVGRKA